MELIVKVDLAQTKEPVARVRHVLSGAAASAGSHVEEVFPELRTGSSAGLLTIRLPCASGSKAHHKTVKALRDDNAVMYVQEPKRRRPL